MGISLTRSRVPPPRVREEKALPWHCEEKAAHKHHGEKAAHGHHVEMVASGRAEMAAAARRGRSLGVSPAACAAWTEHPWLS
mmetsp:Transcript_13789/g.31267  ORF Transcript_13789/g.31267 Transcript_13789/m.31267 type:complete len:82 (+) Transcript_13789:143-388(+)